VLIWIIGQGGLLGSAILHTARSNPNLTVFKADPIPWANNELVGNEFSRLAKRFAAEAGTSPWAIIWAAGHATVASSEADTSMELDSLGSLCDAIRQNTPSGRGAFFLSSSAGGVYAGSQDPPFTLETDPVPLSAYGRLKLAQEELARDELGEVCPVLIGRISNLYGPGQDLAKLQGLISALAQAAVTRKPINMFVSLDTIRDYIYADDAANQILLLMQSEVTAHHHQEAHCGSGTYIVASGQPVSLGYLVNLVHDIARVKVPIALGTHGSASAQSRDLRLTPSAIPGSDRLSPMSLSAGAKNVYLDVLRRVQEAR